MLSTAADPLAIPSYLKIPAAARAAAWATNPPRPMPKFAEVVRGPDVTDEFRAQLAADYLAEQNALSAFKRPDTKKAKEYTSALAEKKARSGAPATPVDRTGMRWGRTRSGKHEWMPEFAACMPQPTKGRCSGNSLPTPGGKDCAKKPAATGGKAREPGEAGGRGSTPRRSTTKEAKPDNGATLLAMLARPEGATLVEIGAATGWQEHTAGARISGVKKVQAVMVTTEERGRVYRTGVNK